MTTFGKALSVRTTNIPGLLVIDLPVHGDSRGWFKENWQREKMLAAGLPDFGPVQNNISFNDDIGTTRGIHAEPWDKFVSVASGKIFGAWVDLREGDTFGASVTMEIDPSIALFVPRGVANSYQTLEANTSYVYLVNDHWSAEAEYTFLNLADETVGIAWPIPLAEATVSEKDQQHPRLAQVKPMPPRKTLIVGGSGQLGRALQTAFPEAVSTTREELDITNSEALDAWNWSEYDTVINAAAYTAVDLAETPRGRADAWKVNATAVHHLARICSEHHLTLVHLSSDYVFDGTKSSAYLETDDLSPLGVYGQSKAAGDIAAASTSRHYIVRTSWVIGDGTNFVNSMASLAEKRVQPSVVSDQFGRLSFAQDIARGISHLLQTKAPFGTFNLTNAGPVVSWAEIAQRVYELSGARASEVRAVTTKEYFANKPGIAPRPLHSELDLGKIEKTGFVPESWEVRLKEYLTTN